MRFHTFFMFFALLVFTNTAKATPSDSIDYYRNLKSMDVSSLWRSDSIRTIENEFNTQGKRIYYTTTVERFPEPYGFIGKDYQRFYIHYLTVKRDTGNHYVYQVTGKTKVKDTIRNFKGTITIVKAKVCKEPTIMTVPKTEKSSIDAAFRQGILTCDIKIEEDTARPKSGTITGRMMTRFYVDSCNRIYYDNLDNINGRYCNNQVLAVWKMNKADTMKRCNWGDYRIPNSGDLDEGGSGFSPADKYLENGWQNYHDANWGGPETPKSKKAAALENVRWWKLQ